MPVEGVEVEVASHRDGASVEAGSVIRHVTVLFSNNSTVILFFRKDRNSEMTALIKSPGLCTSPLGSLVMKPGMSYIASRGELQLWRQDPVKLLQSFSTREHEKEK